MHILINYGIALTGLVLFLCEFFPIQSNLSTASIEPPSNLKDIKFNTDTIYREEINRLVLIIIDALRLDFINEDNMPNLVVAHKDNGCMLSMHVEAPTVTLPRIKALTTGAIPQFSDIILNLASTEIMTDSFLHKAKSARKTIVFYGDDTWIKLYPDMFERQEGVSSFYVSDYTEVDVNVTRNVLIELKKDWDIMVLHYLGLDHIGHVFGPYSPLVKPKLQEMDEIINKIHLASQNWIGETLVVVTGDHGMKDSGGHGGATRSETHVPMVVLGLPCKSDYVAQTDLPVTLVSLMGLPIPSGSVGRVIINILLGWPLEKVLYALRYNTINLMDKLNECGSLFVEASNMHYDYLKFKNESVGNEAKRLYDACSKEISEKLVHLSVNQDIDSLLIGTLILISCLLIVFYNHNLSSDAHSNKIIIPFLIMAVLSKSTLITNLSVIIISISSLYYAVLIIKSLKFKFDVDLYIMLGILLHLLSLFSSSFIEEEHQIWYFFCSTLLLIFCYFNLNTLKCFLLFVSIRVLRNVNQTGDKWAHLPDLAQWFLLEENYYYLQALICISLVLIEFYCLSFENKTEFFTNTILMVLLLIFHTLKIEHPYFIKLIWIAIIINFVVAMKNPNRSLNMAINAWILICSLLIRSHNLILLPFCILASQISSKLVKNVTVLVITQVWFGSMFFFSQGHSNSFASINIAAGYIGLDHYNPFIVIVQVVCHTYTFPILMNLLLLRNHLLWADTIWRINVVYRLFIIAATCVGILIHRHHLFVWTVFAPKLLIESSHSAMLFVEMIVYYCLKKLIKN